MTSLPHPLPPSQTVTDRSFTHASAPCIIGATGGSGTRAVARVARAGGLFLGNNLNAAEDDVDMMDYLNRWVNPYLTRASDPSWFISETTMVTELHEVLGRRTVPGTEPPERWGWKVPKSIYILPFFHEQFPRLKVLHLVRDGRDMAFSPNQWQIGMHGNAVLGSMEEYRTIPTALMAMWTEINMRAADYGEQHLGNQYLCVRFEDLCTQPDIAIDRILDFFELPRDAAEAARREIEPPPTIGRWKAQDKSPIPELVRIGRPALERFGYV